MTGQDHAGGMSIGMECQMGCPEMLKDVGTDERCRARVEHRREVRCEYKLEQLRIMIRPLTVGTRPVGQFD